MSRKLTTGRAKAIYPLFLAQLWNPEEWFIERWDFCGSGFSPHSSSALSINWFQIMILLFEITWLDQCQKKKSLLWFFKCSLDLQNEADRVNCTYVFWVAEAKRLGFLATWCGKKVEMTQRNELLLVWWKNLFEMAKSWFVMLGRI